MSKASRTLYIGNLSKTFKARKRALKRAKEFGTVTRYSFLTSNGQFKGVLFVTYEKAHEAQCALSRLGKLLKDCVSKRCLQAAVRWANPPKLNRQRVMIESTPPGSGEHETSSVCSKTRDVNPEYRDVWKLITNRVRAVLIFTDTRYKKTKKMGTLPSSLGPIGMRS